jgi:hypothetical protein
MLDATTTHPNATPVQTAAALVELERAAHSSLSQAITVAATGPNRDGTTSASARQIAPSSKVSVPTRHLPGTEHASNTLLAATSTRSRIADLHNSLLHGKNPPLAARHQASLPVLLRKRRANIEQPSQSMACCHAARAAGNCL